MSEIKPFKTFKEQLNILKERKLVITDEEKALEALQHLNYYRLSGYTLTLRRNDVFYNNVTFDQVMELYRFDSELRVMLLYLLEYVEVSFRTHVAYHHAEAYGSDGYLDSRNFVNPTYHEKFIQDFNQLIDDEKKSNEIFIRHHKEKYQGKFPIWVAIELFSFGVLSRLYKNLPYEMRRKISKEYYGIKTDFIENWLHGLTILRNICAHRGRLYNRYMTYKPRLSKKDKSLEMQNDRVFIYIYVLKKLVLDEQTWLNFIDMLKNTISRYPFVKLSNLGFPNSWEELLGS